jgi:hypothetical protein
LTLNYGYVTLISVFYNVVDEGIEEKNRNIKQVMIQQSHCCLMKIASFPIRQEIFLQLHFEPENIACWKGYVSI